MSSICSIIINLAMLFARLDCDCHCIVFAVSLQYQSLRAVDSHLQFCSSIMTNSWQLIQSIDPPIANSKLVFHPSAVAFAIVLLHILTIGWVPDSSVNIVSRLRTGRSWAQFPVGARHRSGPRSMQTGCGAH